MAVPTAPTAVSLCFEALRTVNRMEKLHVAYYQWLEEIKSDIWLVAQGLKSLQVSAVKMATIGLSRYAEPIDFNSELSLTILYGNVSGTAQDGSASTLTLAAADSSAEDWVIGKDTLITSGTAKNSMSQATAFDTGTKIVTVVPDFATTPVTGDGYRVIESYDPVIQKPVWEKKEFTNWSQKSRPMFLFPEGNESDAGEFSLYPVPDKAYGLLLKYYLNLQVIDLTSTRISSLYKKWRSIWIAGIMAKATGKVKDSTRYNNSLALLGKKEEYGNDLHDMQVTYAD